MKLYLHSGYGFTYTIIGLCRRGNSRLHIYDLAVEYRNKVIDASSFWVEIWKEIF